LPTDASLFENFALKELQLQTTFEPPCSEIYCQTDFLSALEYLGFFSAVEDQM
jgi:hypothetical protein